MSVNGYGDRRGTSYGNFGAEEKPPKPPSMAAAEWLANTPRLPPAVSEQLPAPIQLADDYALKKAKQVEADLKANSVLRDTVDSQRREINALNDEKRELTSKLDDAEKMKIALAQQGALLTAKVKDLEFNLGNVKENYEHLTGKHADAVAKLAEAQGDAQTFRATYDENKKALESIQREREELKKETENRSALLQGMSAQVESLEASHAALVASSTSLSSKLSEKEVTLQKTEAELADKSKSLETLQREHIDLAAEHAGLVIINNNVTAKLEEVSSERERALATEAKARAELATKVHEASNLAEEKMRAESQLVEARKEATQATKIADDLRKEDAVHAQQAVEAEQKATLAEERLSKMQEEHNREKKALEDSQTLEKHQIRGMLDECNTQVEGLRKQYETHADTTNKQVSKLTLDNHKIRAELDATEKRHSVFVSDALQVVGLLNGVHGFVPKGKAAGNMGEMAKQLQDEVTAMPTEAEPAEPVAEGGADPVEQMTAA